MSGRSFGRFRFELDFHKNVVSIIGRSWSSEIEEEKLADWLKFYRGLIKTSTAKDKSGYSEMVAGLKWAIGIFADG